MPPDSTIPAETSAAIAASSSAPASPARRAASPNVRAVAEHAQRAGERGRWRRQPCQTKQHRVRDAARDDRPDLRGRGRDGSQAAGRRLAQQLAEEERVAARHLAAGADEAGRQARRPTGRRPMRAMAVSVNGAGRSSSAAGSPTSVAASGVSSASSGRVARISPSGCPSSRRAMNASARAEGASHHCRSSTISTSGESAERFDASQYRPCCHA